MIKDTLLKFKFFQKLVEIKLLLKSIIRRTKLLERKFDKKSLSDFDQMVHNSEYIYEKEIELVPKMITEGSVVFDIGANRGEYSYYFAQVVGSKGQVYAFEPGKRAFSLLQKIKDKYQLENVITKKLALSERVGSHVLIVPYFNRQSQLSNSNPIKGRKETISLNTLDNFISEYGIERLDFIKCDTEGSELFVFKGGINTLKMYTPTILVEIAESHTERFNYKSGDVIDFLTVLGYIPYYFNYKSKELERISKIEMKPDSHVWSKLDGNLSNNNYFFIHKSKQKSASLI